MLLSMLSAKVPGTTTPEMLEEVMQDVGTLKWYVVPMLLVVLYILVNELKKGNYNILFGATAFWFMDVFNETWNAMVYATTGQPVWGTTAAGGSALQILVGYNIEISFMFFMLGVVACKLLKTSPDAESGKFFDGNANWLHDPNNMYYMCNVTGKNLSASERAIKTNAAYVVHDLPRRKQLVVLGCIVGVTVLLLIIAGSLGMLGKQIPDGFPYMK